jgi:hypothetical protein
LIRAIDDHDELPERCGIEGEGRKVIKQSLSSPGVLSTYRRDQQLEWKV